MGRQGPESNPLRKQARGTHRLDSDWDVQVIVSDWRHRFDTAGFIIHDKVRTRDGNVAEVVVCHPDDYLSDRFPAQVSVRRDGIDLLVKLQSR